MDDSNSVLESYRGFRIMVVDDDKSFRQIIDRLFRDVYQVAHCENGESAIALAPTFQPDIILLDIHMPGIDGFETCRRLKAIPDLRNAQIVMISADSSWEQQMRASREGADDYAIKPIQPEAFFARIQLHVQLQTTKSSLSFINSKIRSYQLEHVKLVQDQAKELEKSQDIVVFTLAEVADSRDEATGQHLLRMRTYSDILAKQLRKYEPYNTKIDDKFIEDLYRSSPLHDIGKVGIPDGILRKPGPLNASELEIMKQHTIIGANILDGALFRSTCGTFLAMASVIARFHHERWDGKGYPAGLQGEEIPLPARIVALADVYDALTSTRPYHMANSPQMARRIIETEVSKQFDPAVVLAFLERYDDFLKVQMEYLDKERYVLGAMAFAPDTSLTENTMAVSSMINF